MGISIWQLLIILLIVVLLFGTKKLRSIGKDMGGAVRGFRDAMREDDKEETEDKDTSGQGPAASLEHREGERVIEGKVAGKDKEKA